MVLTTAFMCLLIAALVVTFTTRDWRLKTVTASVHYRDTDSR